MNDFLNKFRSWYINYYVEINWFIIGWLSMAAIEAISREQYSTALIDIILIFANYSMYRK